jgi:hypothetical protein
VNRALRGAVAGAGAAAVWGGQQPHDKRGLGTPYHDVELLGKLVTRGSRWPVAGVVMHASNGALFGGTYALARSRLNTPPVAGALAAAMVENFGFWPLGRLIDRIHPARRELEPLRDNRRALAAATWRHALFGVVLVVTERRLNSGTDERTPL